MSAGKRKDTAVAHDGYVDFPSVDETSKGSAQAQLDAITDRLVVLEKRLAELEAWRHALRKHTHQFLHDTGWVEPK